MATLTLALALPSAAFPAPLCAGRGLNIDTNFARAGAQACAIDRTGGRTIVTIKIRPEVEPSNPSPWYGVRITSRRAHNIEVHLDYGRYNHRYHPHLATNIGTWTRVPDENVTIGPQRGKAQIRLHLQAGSHYLAAQPFAPPADITKALDDKVVSGLLTRTTFGFSQAGAALSAYHSQSAKPEGSLILLTRQHPPEVAGEWAFDAFVETILAQNIDAAAFRERFNIIILPNLNPDGMARGFWRANLGLVDLNRDWGPFTQPETRSAGAYLITATSNAAPFAMIDFHATGRDVIYAQPLSAPLAPPGLVDEWLAAWQEALGTSAPEIDRAHNASNANSKTWGRLQFGIAAITYEVGDNTPKTRAQDNARIAAQTLIRAAMAMPQRHNPVNDDTLEPVP